MWGLFAFFCIMLHVMRANCRLCWYSHILFTANHSIFPFVKSSWSSSVHILTGKKLRAMLVQSNRPFNDAQ